jgi:hypothetical protein
MGNSAFPRKPSHRRGLLRGAPPQKWSHFFAKNLTRERAKNVSTVASSESRQGAGGHAGRTCESEIAYASARIRPFSLASGPADCSRNRTPLTRIRPSKGKKQNNTTNKRHHLNLQVLKHSTSFTCLFTRPHGPDILTSKQKWPSA